MKRKRAGGKSAALAAVLAGAASASAEDLDIRPDEAPDPCVAGRGQVQIEVVGLDASGGILTVDLYGDDPDTFLNKKGRLRRVRVPAERYEGARGSQIVCMDVPAAGHYAATTYHDRDGDRDLDKHWNMMPKEPFGLSNNPKLKFGFPPIEPSLFAVSEDGARLVILLREAD